MIRMSKWDRMRSIHRRLNSEMDTVELRVYVPEESYTPGEGFDDNTWSEHDESPIEANPTTPDSDPSRDEAGTQQRWRNQFLVPDDTGIDWTAYGERGEGAMEVEDQESLHRFRLREVEVLHNGLIRIAGDSVDD